MQQPSDRAVGLVRVRPGDDRADVTVAPRSGAITGTAGGELRADLCVIGAGSGGLTVAAGAAQLGVSVVLIEKHKMGGDCLNYGCVPSKALIAAARRAHLMRTSAPFGIVPTNPTISYKGVHDHIHGVIAAIAPNDSAERFTGLGVKVIRATAQFISRDTVLAGDQRIKARRFVIATGSSPAVPPIPGLEGVPYFTNETIFDNRSQLDHLIVIGGGPIGLELAQAYLRLGSRVTVLEAMKALGKDDPEMSEVVLKRLRAEGVEIREGALVERVAGGTRLIDVHISEGGVPAIVQGTHLLVATGRMPNVAEPQPRGRQHQVRQARHPGEQGPRHLELARVRHRRRHRRPAVHARRQLSRRHRPAPGPVPPAGQGRRRHHSLGDVHRPRARPRRPHRGCGEKAQRARAGLPLALPRERPRPGRAGDGRLHQGRDRRQGPDPGRQHRRRACRRADPDVVAGRIAGAEYQGHDAMDFALSDVFRDQQARRLRLLCDGGRQPPGAQGGRLAGESSDRAATSETEARQARATR